LLGKATSAAVDLSGDKMPAMPRKLFLLAILAAITFISCDKDSAPAAEAILHGRWVKGDKTGDTLEFYSRAGVHYLMSNQSFNDDLYAPLEREYRFRNDQLTLIYRNGVDVLEVPA